MQSGHIFQINISAGGVPKLPQREAALDFLGLGGDGHAHPEIHGGPQAALCLFSLERILALQVEGHPIYPGSTGENLTLTGLDWDAIVPGARLRLGAGTPGAGALIEITRFTTPCKTIAASFRDGDPTRILDKKYPGWSRAYARVLQPGRIQIGDQVFVL